MSQVLAKLVSAPLHSVLCVLVQVCMHCFHFFKYWIIKQRTVETSAQGAGMMTETLVVRITENVYMTIATWLLRMFPEIPNKTSLSFSNYDFYFVKILFSVFCLLQLSCKVQQLLYIRSFILFWKNTFFCWWSKWTSCRSLWGLFRLQRDWRLCANDLERNGESIAFGCLCWYWYLNVHFPL